MIYLGIDPMVAMVLGIRGKNLLVSLLVIATAVVGTVSARGGIVLDEIVLTHFPVTAFALGHGSSFCDHLLVVTIFPSPKV